MNKAHFTFLILLLASQSLLSQTGHDIRIMIKDYDEDELYLGYHYGEKQFIRDTSYITDDGYFEFKGADTLMGGIYLIILPPEFTFFEFLITKNEQNFSITTNIDELQGGMIFQGETFENQLFHQYVSFISIRQNQINSLLRDQNNSTKAILDNEKKFTQLRTEIINYQKQLVNKYPHIFVTSIIKMNMPIEYPLFKGTYDQIELQRLLYTKEHIFDDIDLSDERLLRTPFLLPKVEYFVTELHQNDPDSLIGAIDYVLSKMDEKGENFKYFLIHFTNMFAKSSSGDKKGVYSHLVNKYYQSGKAYWVDDLRLNQMLENVKRLNPSSEKDSI